MFSKYMEAEKIIIADADANAMLSRSVFVTSISINNVQFSILLAFLF